MPISAKIKSKTLGILSKINQKNLDKSLELLDKGMKQFSKIIDSFGKSMDAVTSGFSSDIENSNERSKSEAAKNQRNLDILWGSSKSNTKLWSNKK